MVLKALSFELFTIPSTSLVVGSGGFETPIFLDVLLNFAFKGDFIMRNMFRNTAEAIKNIFRRAAIATTLGVLASGCATKNDGYRSAAESLGKPAFPVVLQNPYIAYTNLTYTTVTNRTASSTNYITSTQTNILVTHPPIAFDYNTMGRGHFFQTDTNGNVLQATYHSEDGMKYVNSQIWYNDALPPAIAIAGIGAGGTFKKPDSQNTTDTRVVQNGQGDSVTTSSKGVNNNQFGSQLNANNGSGLNTGSYGLGSGGTGGPTVPAPVIGGGSAPNLILK